MGAQHVIDKIILQMMLDHRIMYVKTRSGALSIMQLPKDLFVSYFELDREYKLLSSHITS